MNPTATKILQDLLYVRNRFTAETSEQIKGHSVLSRVIDFFRECSKHEAAEAEKTAEANKEGNR